MTTAQSVRLEGNLNFRIPSYVVHCSGGSLDQAAFWVPLTDDRRQNTPVLTGGAKTRVRTPQAHSSGGERPKTPGIKAKVKHHTQHPFIVSFSDFAARNRVYSYPMTEKKFQRVVVETLMAILDELKNLNKGGDSEDEGLTQLPLMTVEEVEGMSSELQKRPNTKRSLIKSMSRLGGKDFKTCTRRILDRVFSNAVQRQYNLTGGGRQGKRALKKTAFFSVVLEAVRVALPQAMEEQYQRKWLQCCPTAIDEDCHEGQSLYKKAVQHHPPHSGRGCLNLTATQHGRSGGSLSETTDCNVCLRPTQQPLCNYTDVRTGEPWFCYKPKNLSCDSRINHSRARYKVNIEANETKLFQRDVNFKVYIRAPGPANVDVLPKTIGQPEVKSSNVTSRPSGYYYQGLWQTLDGTTVHQFNISAISQCLKDKVVHMYGDSTIRQWFEYLNAILPDLKEFDLHSPQKVGPYISLDYANNILVTFRCHGPPLSFTIVPVSELRYIANELDGLIGGTSTVVVFGIGAHFCPFPMEVYIWRLQNIRRAVVRLLDRAPGTVVIIRTGNPRAPALDVALTFGDWYSLQHDKVLRAMFKGLNVHLVDAWEMVVAHHLPHDIHPSGTIIKNMLNVLLSYVCPQKGG
ncbi:hypothetical protein ABVT39_013138 [Epinephelus coioides]